MLAFGQRHRLAVSDHAAGDQFDRDSRADRLGVPVAPVTGNEARQEAAVFAACDRVDRVVQFGSVDPFRDRGGLGAHRSPPARVEFRDRERREHLIERRAIRCRGFTRQVRGAQRRRVVFRLRGGDEMSARDPLDVVGRLRLAGVAAHRAREEREAAHALALDLRFERERVLGQIGIVAREPGAERCFGLVERDEVAEPGFAHVFDRALDAFAFRGPVAAHARDVGADRQQRSRRHHVHRVDERPARFEIAFGFTEAAEPRRHQRAQVQQPAVHPRRRNLGRRDLRAELVDQRERPFELADVAEHQHAKHVEVDAHDRQRVGRQAAPDLFDFLEQQARIDIERAQQRGDRPDPRVPQHDRAVERGENARIRDRHSLVLKDLDVFERFGRGDLIAARELDLGSALVLARRMIGRRGRPEQRFDLRRMAFEQGRRDERMDRERAVGSAGDER